MDHIAPVFEDQIVLPKIGNGSQIRIDLAKVIDVVGVFIPQDHIHRAKQGVALLAEKHRLTGKVVIGARIALRLVCLIEPRFVREAADQSLGTDANAGIGTLFIEECAGVSLEPFELLQQRCIVTLSKPDMVRRIECPERGLMVVI